MSDKKPFGFQKPQKSPAEVTADLDRVDVLVSQLLDEELGEAEYTELEGILMESGAARTEYVGLMQLHVDLTEYYRPESTTSETSPVLGGLSQFVDVMPQVPNQPHE